ARCRMAAGAAWQCWPSLPQSVLLAQTSPVQASAAAPALLSSKHKDSIPKGPPAPGPLGGKSKRRSGVLPKNLHSVFACPNTRRSSGLAAPARHLRGGAEPAATDAGTRERRECGQPCAVPHRRCSAGMCCAECPGGEMLRASA
ncbi:MAG: hypothetical protein ACPIOQ_07420, partial [Promethearchaeia archaeon]